MKVNLLDFFGWRRRILVVVLRREKWEKNARKNRSTKRTKQSIMRERSIGWLRLIRLIRTNHWTRTEDFGGECTRVRDFSFCGLSSLSILDVHYPSEMLLRKPRWHLIGIVPSWKKLVMRLACNIQTSTRCPFRAGCLEIDDLGRGMVTPLPFYLKF